jgi:hypothetical protein
MPCPDRMSLCQMKRWCRTIAPAVLASALLTGCATPDCPRVATSDYSQYARCLPSDESVTAAAQVGAFTVLDVYRSALPLPFSSGHGFKRVLYQGRTVVDETDAVHPWPGKDVLFSRLVFSKTGKAQFHLIYAKAGKALVEDIGDPGQGYHATTEFPYGYPLTPELRYFGDLGLPDSRGYLLSVFPTRVVTLPMTPGGMRTPLVGWLAAVAPDGKAFAFIDDYEAVSAIQVVDADGASRGLVAIPLTPLAQPGAGQHPFEPAWRWFAATYQWDKNEHGAWIVSRRAPAPPQQNPLEELFIDARVGYRQCFAEGDPACLRGWGPRKARLDSDEECCLSKYAWAPTTPARAFGAEVRALFYARLGSTGSGYEMMLDAPHDNVSAAIVRGLQARNVPFVRLDECQSSSDGAKECLSRMERTVGWKTPIDDGPVRQMLDLAQQRAVFMTPTAAFVVFPMDDGSTLLSTLARHDLTTPAKRVR